MSHKINWAPALNDLRALDREVSERIVKKVCSIVDNPFRYVEKLVDYPLFKLRIGDYRAIVDIQKEEIIVVLVDHRHKVYKRLR